MTEQQQIATVQAADVYFGQFQPAMRSLTEAIVESGKRLKLAADVYKRMAHLMKRAGSEVAPVEQVLGAWHAAVVALCRAVTENGILHRTDPVFDGFDF